MDDLTGLSVLSLNGNRFTEFPKLSAGVQFIRTLNLFNNLQSVGSFSFHTMDRMNGSSFFPTHCVFTTAAYSSSVQLNSVSSLNLGFNAIVNVSSEFIEAFPALQTLSFRINSIQTVPMFNNSNLQSLDLSSNQINSIAAGAFTNLPKLQSLYLDNNNLKSYGQCAENLESQFR